MELAPIPVAAPLLVAAAILIASSLPWIGRRRVADVASIVTAGGVTVLCVMLLVRSSHATIVYWFGAWTPRHGIALGISFTIDPLGAGLAALAAALVTASFVFTWWYFDAVHNLFHTLMLAFLAAMTGFCLTGDVFDMFVFFELMGVAAFALTATKTEEKGPIQGALNFAIVNSIGAFLILSGIGLLYGRSGALNMAQIGRALAGRPVDGLVIVAFTFITVGFFVKAAIVPFHFWLADAHAVAPSPVCVLFSGVMVELGVYAVYRLYWTMFAGALHPHEQAVRAVLIGAGVVTMLWGAIMCVLQHHLKRLLAFSTISHVGIFVAGAALLSPLGLAGSAVYVLGHAMVKGSLFLCTGILLNRLESVDELILHGKGRRLPITGILFLAGGLGLASLPPFGTFLGKGMIEDAAEAAGYKWIVVALIIASALTGSAVLRATGRVFAGWGPRPEEAKQADREEGDEAANEGEKEQSETGQRENRTPPVMLAPAIVLMILGFLIGLAPGLGTDAEVAAARFENRPAYAAAVLGGAAPHVRPAALEPAGPNAAQVISGLISTAGAIGFALFALLRHRLPEPWRQTAWRLVLPVVKPLRAVHSGHVGDYVAWLTLGAAGLGSAFAFAIMAGLGT